MSLILICCDFAVNLVTGRVQRHDHVPKVLKLGLVLQLRISKFPHRELTHPYRHRTRPDLVMKRVANLGGGKRQLSLAELWQALEVGEDSLSVLALVLQLLRCVR